MTAGSEKGDVERAGLHFAASLENDLKGNITEISKCFNKFHSGKNNTCYIGECQCPFCPCPFLLSIPDWILGQSGQNEQSGQNRALRDTTKDK